MLWHDWKIALTTTMKAQSYTIKKRMSLQLKPFQLENIPIENLLIESIAIESVSISCHICVGISLRTILLIYIPV